MKNIRYAWLLGIVCVLIATQAMAYPVDTLITPFSPGTNPQNLGNANPTTEETWLEGILGLTYNDPSVVFIDKNESYFKNKDLKSLDGWDPGFAWTYAVIKYGQLTVAFMDEGDNLVTVPGTQGPYSGTFPNGISHITFFRGLEVSVPEPATMILLGLGLLGLGIAVRKRS